MRPNLVLFIPDQLSVDAVGAFGNPIAQTPHIDALAARGTLFTNAYGAALGVPYEQLFWRSGVAQSARVGDWKLNVSGSDKVWLYDLATDPGEETNLAEARPDKLAELQSALAQHNADQPMTADSA
jgi:arylsulfatase A-like enzyme